MTSKLRHWIRAFAVTATFLGVGCDGQEAAVLQPVLAEKSAEEKPSAVVADGQHGHKAGEHGGLIVAIGRDNYHAEVVFEKGGVLRLYTLGKDEARIQEVESQTLTAYVKAAGAQQAASVTLRAEPLPDDSPGKTSQFAGQLPEELWDKSMEVTIPSIRIAGERFRLGFQSVPAKHIEEMPDQIADAEERQICLTPGGKYTQADIQANGNVLPSQKYRGVMFPHSEPQPGDMTCPIGKSKATPKCTWVVGGKTYQFC